MQRRNRADQIRKPVSKPLLLGLITAMVSRRRLAAIFAPSCTFFNDLSF